MQLHCSLMFDYYLRGDVKKEVLVFGGAHHKVAYPPPSELWSPDTEK